MSDTCRLFPLFGDPWTSCLLPSPYHSIYFFLLLKIFFSLCWVFAAQRGLSPISVSGGHSLLTVTAPPLPLSPIMGSREGRLSSCGSQTLLPPSMQDLPGLGIELVSPALQSRFLTIGLPEKPCFDYHSFLVLSEV